MLKDITIGQYFPVESPIHKMDARVKILLAIAYMVVIFLIQNFWGYLLLAAFTGAVIATARIPLKFVFKGLKPLFFFILFTAVLNLFMTGNGTVLWQWGWLKITDGGVYYALFMVLRISFLVLGTSLLTYTTTPISLTDGIEYLLKPFAKIGLPAHELAMMMTIALRFIPTLLDETDKITKAQSARGADFESGSLIQRAKALIPVLVPLFISAFRRADELAVAMESRCYHGGTQRTRLNVLKAGRIDAVGATEFLVFVAGVVALNLAFGKAI